VFLKAFQQLAFFNIGLSLARNVGKLLGHQQLQPDIVKAMSRAKGVLHQMGGDGSMGSFIEELNLFLQDWTSLAIILRSVARDRVKELV
jgi:hypothetical protein